MKRVRARLQWWRGVPGVYYPDQSPPASVRLAVPKPPPSVAIGRKRLVIDPERAAAIANAYRASGSLEKAKRAGKCGTRIAQEAIVAAGLTLSPWRRTRDREGDAAILSAYERIGTIHGTAKHCGIGSGRVYRVLHDAGIEPPSPGRPKRRTAV